MTAYVVRADARCLPLPDASVDLIVTSPPYFALRSYQDAGEHYDGQLGSEPTPGEFLDALIDCTRDWIRVLKPSGSLWVNLGDKYGRRQNTNVPQTKHGPTAAVAYPSRVKPSDMPKSLLGVPWRYAIRCTDELGLTLRAEVIWDKPNGLPESVRDRVRRSHETWFHFVLDPFGYYSAVDEIREPHSQGTHPGRTRTVESVSGNGVRHRTFAGNTDLSDPRGRVPGSVWEIPSEPLLAPAVSPLDGRPLPDHFAAFPTEWPRRLIAGFSPVAICTACGEGRRPVADAQQHDNGKVNSGRAKRQLAAQLGHDRGFNAAGYPHTTRITTIAGYVCACTPYVDHPERRRPTSTPKRDDLTHRPVPNLGHRNTLPPAGPPVREYLLDDWQPAATYPAVVADPFGGTGTTALVADVLGRTGVSFDLSHDYGRLARWRTTDPGERARAMRVDKPPVQVTDQAVLFDA